MSQSLKLCHAPLVNRTGLVGAGTTVTLGFFTTRGLARIEGVIFSDVALDMVNGSPTPGPVIQGAMNAAGIAPPVIDRARVYPQDPGDVSGGFVYPIDHRNLSRYSRLVYKTANAANVRIELWGRPDNGGDQV